MTANPMRVLRYVLPALLPLVHPVFGQTTISRWSGVANTIATADWMVDGNWIPGDGYPRAANVIVVFDDTASVTNGVGLDGVEPETRVAFSFTGSPLSDPAEVDLAGIWLTETNTVSRAIRNRSGTTTSPTLGFLNLHGWEDTVNGQPVTMLLRNDSLENTLRVHALNDNARLYLRLPGSGVMHVEHPDAVIRMSLPLYEGANPVAITKTGKGLLQFGISRSAFDGRNETTGGLIIEDGIIQVTFNNTTSGGATVLVSSPYGFGPITMRKGGIQSNSTTARTIYNEITLDGEGFFGSTDPDLNGDYTIHASTGNATTLASDSTLVIHNTTQWNQEIGGPYSLTKRGLGALALNGPNPHTGTLVAAEGILYLNGSTQGEVEVLAGAVLGGSGSIGGQAIARSGSMIEPDALGPRLTISGALTLEANSTASFTLIDATTHSGFATGGDLSLDGANLMLQFLHIPQDGEVYVLVDNTGGAGSVTGTFLHEGTPVSEGGTFTVDGQTFQISYNYNQDGFQNSIAVAAGNFPGGGDDRDFATWRAQRFAPEDPDGEPLAQPAGQVVVNLLFHALGLDLVADVAASLPQAIDGAPTISFTRRSPLGSRLIVEVTGGNPGGTWDTLAVLEPGASAWTGSSSVNETPKGAGVVQVTATDTLSTFTEVHLMRVRAVLP